jgi:hypothetical protein
MHKANRYTSQTRVNSNSFIIFKRPHFKKLFAKRDLAVNGTLFLQQVKKKKEPCFSLAIYYSQQIDI